MLERGGELVTRVVSSRTKPAMHTLINSHILPGTTVHTDEFGGYKDLADNGFNHVKVDHSAKVYATAGGAGVNAIEGFWAALKRGISGTHIHISGKHLPKYLGEFEYRYNMRHVPHLMLHRMVFSFVR
ncbi:MAG: IS1595 family transposase [Sphingomonadaceae bacterium]